MAVSCLPVFFIMAVIILPHGVNCILRCYSCTSYESWEDCNSKKNLEKAECPSESPKCIKGVLTCTGSNKQTIYFKGCATQEDSCDAIKESAPTCGSGTSSFANTCCTGNYCNSGSSQKISSALRKMCIVLLLLWGLLAAFVY